MHNPDFKILYRDAHVTVLEKPKGILSEDAQSGEKGVVGILSEYSGKPVHLLHRLDRNVGGVMVFANNKQSAGALSKDIAEGRFFKEYLAVTDGIPQEEKGVYKDFLFKDSKKNRSFVVKRIRKGVREASLEYEVLAKTENKAMVQVLLHTGRTHQIRVQFSSRKTPLTGDRKYGSRDGAAGEIALHSCRITFTHPATKEKMCFESAPDYSGYPWSLFGGK